RKRLEDRLPKHFVEGRGAFPDLLQTGHAEADHPLLDRLALQLDGGGAREDHVPDLVGELEDFEEAQTALIPRLCAAVATAAALDLEGLDLVRREADLDEHLRRRLDFLGALRA